VSLRIGPAFSDSGMAVAAAELLCADVR